jgi:hypothetical protein
MADRFVSSGWHYSYGWLRRPELDNNGWHCYEDGDGDLYLTDYPGSEKLLLLECRTDIKTGENYLCFSKLRQKVKK